MIVIGRHTSGVSINDLEYLMNEDSTDYWYFKDKREAMDFLNSTSPDIKLSDDALEDLFYFLDTETDFENPEVFKKAHQFN